MPTIFIGDSGDTLTDTLTDGGIAKDLTNATVHFHARHIVTGTVVRKTAAIVSAAAGTVKYVTVASDFPQVGTYGVQWEVVWNDGTRTTFQSAAKLDVKQDYADGTT